MTKNLLFLFVFLLISIGTFAQNKVYFNIHHKLNEGDFEMNRTANNNINTPFQITRLEYYISEISLIHDGGQETKINDLWVLVNADSPTQVDLGDHNIDKVEKIAFHIGVDSAHNNSDPSLYPAGHPLALKFPSMHWGWAIGYNFIALEGTGGDALDKVFQIHALGNENYRRYEIEQNVSAVNNRIDINIDGDYARALEDLDASIGIFYHGTTKEARKLIGNFHDLVFSASENTATTIRVPRPYFEVYPNPVPNSEISIALFDDNPGTNYEVIITDIITGRQITTIKSIVTNKPINLSTVLPGSYIISCTKDGKHFATDKFVVLH